MELGLNVEVDNASGFSHLPGYAGDLERHGNIEFRYVPHLSGRGGHYEVSAWGALFPTRRRPYRGCLLRNDAQVLAAIDDCLEAWHTNVLELKVADDEGVRFPFADHWNLNTTTDHHHLDQVGLELARAGHKLFTVLFRAGDEGLRTIANRLAEVLRAGEQVLAFHSDDLFAPWWMLYIPPDPATNLYTRDPPWSLSGFLGYQHVIEHQFREGHGESRIKLQEGLIRVGLNVDSRLDRCFPMPCVSPVVTYFQGNDCHYEVREAKEVLGRALQSADFADQIVYFGCHGGWVRAGSRGVSQAQLVLADDKPIRASDFCAWLSDSPFKTNPVIFVNACQGGHMSSPFYTSFGPELMRQGANCLIGPQLDLPAAFAAEYATRLFQQFLQPDIYLGEVVRGLVREFADHYRNPLGLIFSLYQGLDTRFILDNEES